jgi:hypothetical protein
VNISPEITKRKREILIAAAAIALGKAAYRSWKLEGDNITFDVSVWGKKVKSVIAYRKDDSNSVDSIIAGEVKIGPDNEVYDAVLEEGHEVSEEVLGSWEDALSDKDSWRGQPPN